MFKHAFLFFILSLFLNSELTSANCLSFLPIHSSLERTFSRTHTRLHSCKIFFSFTSPHITCFCKASTQSCHKNIVQKNICQCRATAAITLSNSFHSCFAPFLRDRLGPFLFNVVDNAWDYKTKRLHVQSHPITLLSFVPPFSSHSFIQLDTA